MKYSRDKLSTVLGPICVSGCSITLFVILGIRDDIPICGKVQRLP